MPAASQEAVAIVSSLPLAHHLHGGTACTADVHNPACANHPGELVVCKEFHLPFFGTMHTCVHHVMPAAQ